jgi:hypothetical protein
MAALRAVLSFAVVATCAGSNHAGEMVTYNAQRISPSGL